MYLTEVAQTLTVHIPNGTVRLDKSSSHSHKTDMYRRNSRRKIQATIPTWMVYENHMWKVIFCTNEAGASYLSPYESAQSYPWKPLCLALKGIEIENFFTVGFVRSLVPKECPLYFYSRAVPLSLYASQLLTMKLAATSILTEGHEGFFAYLNSLIDRQDLSHVFFDCFSRHADLYHAFKGVPDVWSRLGTLHTHFDQGAMGSIVDALNQRHGTAVKLECH